jgi:hypothetical protein
MLAQEYNISQSPFELPIIISHVECKLSRALHFGKREGTNLATSIRGVFRAALYQLGCQKPSDNCAKCQTREACSIPFLFGPRSEAQRRDFASPIILWPTNQSSNIDIALIFWGRRVRQYQAMVNQAINIAGENGLDDSAGRVEFVARSQLIFDGTLKQWIAREYPDYQNSNRACVELIEPPLAVHQTTRAKNGHEKPSLAAILGNTAHDLVLWDLEDRGMSPELAKSGCDQLAQMARELATAALAKANIEAGFLTNEDYGKRYSRQNNNTFALKGIRGYTRIGGNLDEVFPWLAALSLRGGGAKKSFGLGRVRLSLLGASMAEKEGRAFLRSCCT